MPVKGAAPKPAVVPPQTPGLTPAVPAAASDVPALVKSWSPKAAAASLKSPSVVGDLAVANGLRALANAGTTLKSGDAGPAVVQLQEALKKLGYSVKVDGQFGPATAGVLNEFARANHLPSGKGKATGELERALSLRIDRNNFGTAVAKLCNTFAAADPRFVETSQQAFRDIAAETDPKKRAAKLNDWLTKVDTQAQTHAPALDAISGTWRSDWAAVRAHVNDAEKVPSETNAELKFARNAFSTAAQQQFTANVALVADALREQSPADAKQFVDLIDQLESTDPTGKSAVTQLDHFFAQHGLQALHQQRPEVRRAWVSMMGTLVDGERTGNFKAVADFTQATFMRHTLESIKADPNNPGNVELTAELKARLAAMEKAAGNSAAALTGDTLRAVVPSLTPAYAAELATSMQTAMDRANIKTPRERAAFIAQCAHETMDFKSFHELGPDSYFSKYDNRKDLGNRGHPDGMTYKGRGALQLTGRANYAAFSAWDTPGGREYVDHPERVANPGPAFTSAAYFWSTHKLNKPAEQNDLKLVTETINGGTNGWADRLSLYTRALAALSAAS